MSANLVCKCGQGEAWVRRVWVRDGCVGSSGGVGGGGGGAGVGGGGGGSAVYGNAHGSLIH